MNYQAVLDEIEREVQPLLSAGKVASYIPELSHVPVEQFGMAVLTVDGELFETGRARQPFSVQSVSKLFSLTLAMVHGGNDIWRRVGREPSGTAFNSLVQLEAENGIPRNPFINAGALVITDIILSALRDAKTSILELVRGVSGNPRIGFDLAVARSEADCGHRNTAMASFLKSFGNLENEAEAVLDAYFHHCSLSMSAVDLARASLYLANGGRVPHLQDPILGPSQTKYVNSLMLTCGTYDAVGDFAYRVGLPGKSGVGGGIVAVMPGHFSVCVWSPGLNSSGNSLVGTQALELFTTKTGLSIF